MKARSKQRPMSGTQRYQRWNRKLSKAGGRRVTAHIGPEAAKVLHELTEFGGDSVSAVLNRALIHLSGRPVLERPSNYGRGATRF